MFGSAPSNASTSPRSAGRASSARGAAPRSARGVLCGASGPCEAGAAAAFITLAALLLLADAQYSRVSSMPSRRHVGTTPSTCCGYIVSASMAARAASGRRNRTYPICSPKRKSTYATSPNWLQSVATSVRSVVTEAFSKRKRTSCGGGGAPMCIAGNCGAYIFFCSDDVPSALRRLQTTAADGAAPARHSERQPFAFRRSEDSTIGTATLEVGEKESRSRPFCLCCNAAGCQAASRRGLWARRRDQKGRNRQKGHRSELHEELDRRREEAAKECRRQITAAAARWRAD